jgi:NhaP-type Na+/H+ or K+/H+ antiporter
MRFFWTVVGGVVASLVSFVIFNVLYGLWAVWRSPQHNSMAGLTAFIYGMPVGLAFGILAGILIWVSLRKLDQNESWPEKLASGRTKLDLTE